ncbi:helix-turn-helix transcriptional regulator [Aureimonas sp. SK2]|uniref:helix-turn-helix domain-containing protein n=1 Tax=Aureimonas sp. SK2 TaxID=3015992 RepID=UPI002444B157|nr:helix-turn-helix transcriptional regulator [Aureimonas sp. SK2]
MTTLKEWRERQGWSTQRVAEELGLDPRAGAGTIWRWETGRSRPDADVVEKIEGLTGGAVNAVGMHKSRLEFLRSRPGLAERPCSNDAAAASCPAKSSVTFSQAAAR